MTEMALTPRSSASRTTELASCSFERALTTTLAPSPASFNTVARPILRADPVKAAILSARLAHLHRRSLALDVAVVLGAVGGAATCGAVLTLFVGALREATVASMLFGLFGLAVICALGAIVAFTVEMLMASIGIRDLVESGRKGAEADAAEAAEPQQDAGENPAPSNSA